MSSKSLTRALVALPVAALAVGVAALAATAGGSGPDVAAPSVGYSAAGPVAAPGLAPTTTSRDWQEVAASAVRPRPGRF
jgi:hypothetical protein